MALIKCPECGEMISDKAKVCIHCGAPINEGNEKTTVKTSNEVIIRLPTCSTTLFDDEGKPVKGRGGGTVLGEVDVEIYNKETNELLFTGTSNSNACFDIGRKTNIKIVYKNAYTRPMGAFKIFFIILTWFLFIGIFVLINYAKNIKNYNDIVIDNLVVDPGKRYELRSAGKHNYTLSRVDSITSSVDNEDL